MIYIPSRQRVTRAPRAWHLWHVARPSPISLLIQARKRDIGGGAMVQRLLPFSKRRMVGPFTFFDAFGPADVAAGGGVDVPPHPHVHLATVTYLFEGENVHRDSLGTVARIRPGDMGWMNAGRGIVHSERAPEELLGVARRSHGLQAWVALPDADEDSEPSFQHVAAERLPSLESGGLCLRVLAGEAFGARAPIDVFSPLFYVEVAAGQSGGEIELPSELGERAVFTVHGEVRVETQRVPPMTMAVIDDDSSPQLVLDPGAVAMLLGGAPLGPRHMYWNFVGSTPERIEAAIARWRTLDFPLIDDDQDEHVPLPE